MTVEVGRSYDQPVFVLVLVHRLPSHVTPMHARSVVCVHELMVLAMCAGRGATVILMR